MKKGNNFAKLDEPLFEGQSADRVADRLGPRTDRWSIIGRLGALYIWGWRNAPDGFIEGPPHLAIIAAERAMHWRGKRGLLVKVLVAEGFLRWARAASRDEPETFYDEPSEGLGLHICGWFERYGEALQERARDTESKRLRRLAANLSAENHEETSKTVRRTSSGHPADNPPDIPRTSGGLSAGHPAEHPADSSRSWSLGGAGGTDVRPPAGVLRVVVEEVLETEKISSPPPPPPPGSAYELEGEELYADLGDDAAGFWMWITLERERHGLSREARQPRGFAVWYAKARKHATISGLCLAWAAYSRDHTFGPEGTTPGRQWPTAVFITEGVWMSRVPTETREAVR